MAELKIIDLKNKCGSCGFYSQIKDTAWGCCLRQPYGDDVVHDPQLPYRQVPRSRVKCPYYKEVQVNG